MAKRNNKIIKNPNRKIINPGIVAFAVIVLYLLFSVIIFLTRKRITFYEVVYGKNATAANKSYNALILRDEKIVNSTQSGYVNYFINEGGRASLNTIVYSIDENGNISELLTNNNKENLTLSENDMNKIKSQIMAYIGSYDNMEFDNVYNFKTNIEATVLDYINVNILNNIGDILANSSNVFKTYTSEETGTVAFYEDGFENFSPANISINDFDLKKYNKKSVKSNSLIEQGDFVYKVINNEQWSLLFKLSDDEYEEYKNETRLSVKLLEKDINCSGNFSIIQGTDGYYGKLTLEAFLNEFISERFTEIKIINAQSKGLKIPKSSVVEKDFYVIPVSYIGRGGNSSREGFFKQVTGEDGNVSVEFVSPAIYYKTDQFYYVSMDDFNTNDVIVMNDSTSVYGIGQTGKVKGVYNINNGYCIFKVIDIIGETSDYYIVSSNTNFGLVVYDHIVLDGELVNENQIIFKIQ